MHQNEKLKVLTGGSSVYHGRWSACDRPTHHQQFQIEQAFGIFLLANGLVDQIFSYHRDQNTLIIQSRRRWFEKPQPHIFSTSLLKALVDCNMPLKVTSPFDPQTTKAIRRRIDRYLENLDLVREYKLI